MKKLLSLLLAAALFITIFASIPSAATVVEDVFHEGDVLFLRVESPSNWVDDCLLYANFTAASREDNGGSSVVIADADRELYDPVQGIAYDPDRALYRYEVTAADAGASAMRFWRGNGEKLWNCSVVLTASDYAGGKNTAVVTDWTDAGYTEHRDPVNLEARIELSAAYGLAGDTFEIRAIYSCAEILNVACELYIDDELVSETDNYLFTPAEDGIYEVTAKLTATHFHTGALLAQKELSETITVGSAPLHAVKASALYAHAARGSKDQDAWIRWYGIDGTYYLFLPSCIRQGEPVELYSAYREDATLDTVTVPAYGIVDFTPDPAAEYLFRVGRTTRTVKFLYSSAESALFVNNTDDFDGSDFLTYLQEDKEHSVAALGAYTNENGTVTDVEIKKMKGRGNTSWEADKKGFNITFKDTVSIAGMEKGKKFSLISNFQDAAMLRNRILFDLSDAVGVPYASDSRMVDLYANGVYQGTYQLCQKIEVGKNSLMSDVSDDDYLDKETGGVKPEFSFVVEIDSSPSQDDFYFNVQNGNNLTVKAPELSADDANLRTVRGFIKNRYNTMYNKLNSGAADAGDYIDLDSLAKVYLINELGKNWDSGASSFFLTYKPDAEGNYKFFASPVWDYDNSLGNAKGIEWDLRNMGITDYTLPTGWFSTKKNGYNGPNFLATAAKHSAVMEQVYKVWFEDFVPALAVLTKTGVKDGELYSADVYYEIMKDTAEMNYHVWELVTDTRWIADHSSLQPWVVAYTYDGAGRIIGADAQPERCIREYDQYSYQGQFDYMLDWTLSRAAWISGQYIAHYHPDSAEDPSRDLLGDVNLSGEVDILDATLIQRHLASLEQLTQRQLAASDTNRSGEIDILDATLIQRYLAGLLKEF